MSKGSGVGGTGGGTSGGSGGSRGKVTLGITGRRTLSGKAVQGLISGRGGITKSVGKFSTEKLTNAKNQYKGLTKSQIGIYAGKVFGVKIKISHAYRNLKGGGGDMSLESGSEQVLAAKQAGAEYINATVIQVGARGKVTTWNGLVKL